MAWMMKRLPGRWSTQLLAFLLSTGCATAQLERDIAVIRDELDSLRADYKRQSRDVEFLTARVLTMNTKTQSTPQIVRRVHSTSDTRWETPQSDSTRGATDSKRALLTEPKRPSPTVREAGLEPEPELPPIVLTMADLNQIDGRSLPVHSIPPAPDFGLSAASVPETAQAQRDFGRALDLYADGKLTHAVEAFRAYLITHAASAKRFDVYFWLGESLLELGELNEAILSFQQVVQHPKPSTRVPDALYKIGLCHRRSGREEKAQETFRRVVDDYPSSAVSSLARTQLTRGEL